MKRIHKDKVPQRILNLFSSNEKARWLLNDKFELFDLLWLYCLSYININWIFPFFQHNYKIITGGLELNKSICSFAFENILALFGVFLFFKCIEYVFFTKAIFSSKKLYVSGLFKVISIDKENIDRSSVFLINLICPFYSVIKTYDGKLYWFSSSSLAKNVFLGITRGSNSKEKLKIENIGSSKKEQKYKDNSLNKRLIYNPIIACSLITLIIIVFCYSITLYLYDFQDFLLPAKTFKHNVLYRSLKFIDKLGFCDSNLAIWTRNKLFVSYKTIYNSFDVKKYNAIAPFYHIVDEFECYEKTKDKTRIDVDFLNYQIKIMGELSFILKEYEHRNEYYSIGMHYSSNWRSHFFKNIEYSIPDRIFLYPYLANFYLEHKSDVNDFEQWQNILNNYDEILFYEKNNNSIMYQNANRKWENYGLIMKQFFGLYSYKILSNELKNNKDSFCTNKNLFNRLSQVQDLDKKYQNMMIVINDMCDYGMSEN